MRILKVAGVIANYLKQGRKLRRITGYNFAQ